MKHSLVVIILLLAGSCCQRSSAGKSSTSFGATPLQNIYQYPVTPPELVIVGDPQLHNVAGGRIMQGSTAASAFVKVARRSPELNILAPLVFRDLLEEALQSRPRVALILGDATNVACTGEFDLFKRHLETALGQSAAGGSMILPILAHGNHDSYLSGTLNTFGPAANRYEEVSRRIRMDNKDNSMPTDEDWFLPVSGLSQHSWPGACSDGQGSEPMNKSRWLSRYFAMLKDHFGLVVQARKIGLVEDRVWSLSGKAGNLEVQGRWYPPRFGPNQSADFTRTSKSFVVQFLDMGDEELIVLDTSVCEIASAKKLKFISTNAGTHGCVGSEQLAIIAAHVLQKKKPVIFAGHFNLEEILVADRRRLVTLIADSNAVYLSAHTHGAPSLRLEFGAPELNFGSTTDWPMTVALMDLHQGRPSGVQLIKNGRKPKLKYDAPALARLAKLRRWSQEYELCRHIEVARILASLSTKQTTTWKRPEISKGCLNATPPQLAKFQEEMAGYLSTIEDKFAASPVHRDFYLAVAAEASYVDSQQRTFEIP